MVTLQILVLPFLVRVRVPQPPSSASICSQSLRIFLPEFGVCWRGNSCSAESLQSCLRIIRNGGDMSYDIVIIDRRQRYKSCKEFLDSAPNWIEESGIDDYRQSSPNLQRWFLSMKELVRPLNGEFSPKDDEIGNGEYQEADYSFGKEYIYAALAWSDAEKTVELALKLARENHLALYDISGILYNADGSSFHVSRQQAGRDAINEECQRKFKRRSKIVGKICIVFMVMMSLCLIAYYIGSPWGLYVTFPLITPFVLWGKSWIEHTDQNVISSYDRQHLL